MDERRSRLTPLLIAIILAEAGAIAFLCLLLARQGRQATEQAKQGQHSQAEAQKRIADLQTQVGKLKAQAKPANATPRVGDANDYAARYLRRMASPEMAALRAQISRATVSSAEAALYRFLHLPPNKLAAFRDLQIEQQQEMIEIRAEATAQHITDRDALAQLTAQNQQEMDAKIEAALGSDSFAQLQYYRQTLPQRNEIQQLQTALSFGDTPLTDAQGEQLVRLLADNAPPPAAPDPAPHGPVIIVAGPSIPSGSASGPILTDTVMSQAAAILSPPQMEALRAMQQAEQASAQMRAAMAKPENPAP